MAAKEPSKTIKTEFSDHTQRATTSASDEDAPELWSSQTPSRYARSYDALSTALMAIFESYHLPRVFMAQDPDTGEARLTDSAEARYRECKELYMFYMHDDAPEGTLQIDITPSPSYRGILNTGLADNYMNGAEEIKTAITHFFDDLVEMAAGIAGVKIDPQSHQLTIAGPQPFYNLVNTLCQDIGIITSERHHERYAESGWDDQILEQENKTPEEEPDNDDITGKFIARYMGSNDPELADYAAIPQPLFQAMGAVNYSFREIGQLVNRFKEQGTMPLFSLDALQAVVDQDLAGSNISKRHPHFNLH